MGEYTIHAWWSWGSTLHSCSLIFPFEIRGSSQSQQSGARRRCWATGARTVYASLSFPLPRSGGADPFGAAGRSPGYLRQPVVEHAEAVAGSRYIIVRTRPGTVNCQLHLSTVGFKP
jgi:hypothetical protein